MPDRKVLTSAKRVVIKVGSKLLQDSPAGCPAAIADEIAALRGARDLEFAVVSSGAIALGMRSLRIRVRPDEMPMLQAVAAVGQRVLLTHWSNAFLAHELTIGQVLLTYDDVADRRRFLSARHALEALFAAGVVPIINENDTVATDEIRYGDNDVLAALVCNLLSADALIILTDVDGLYDGDRKRIPIVRDIAREAEPMARGSGSGSPGTGGMATKVQAARKAGRNGTATVIVPGGSPQALTRALAGDDIGTLFVPPDDRINSRKHWIAYGPKPAGQIRVDAGARAALVENQRSLLPAGVTAVTGSFRIGDIVSVLDDEESEFARGLTCYGSDDVARIQGCQSADLEATLGYKYVDEVIRRDDLVIL